MNPTDYTRSVCCHFGPVNRGLGTVARRPGGPFLAARCLMPGSTGGPPRRERKDPCPGRQSPCPGMGEVGMRSRPRPCAQIDALPHSGSECGNPEPRHDNHRDRSPRLLHCRHCSGIPCRVRFWRKHVWPLSFAASKLREVSCCRHFESLLSGELACVDSRDRPAGCPLVFGQPECGELLDQHARQA